MARIVYSPTAQQSLERIFEFIAENDPHSALTVVYAVRGAIEILAEHPLIGRPTREPLRELVISVGRTGYVALYRFLPHEREVRILAIRHQRELDYSP